MKVKEDELMTNNEENVESMKDNLQYPSKETRLKWIQIFNIHPDKIGECEDEKWRLKMN